MMSISNKAFKREWPQQNIVSLKTISVQSGRSLQFTKEPIDGVSKIGYRLVV